jgi:NAD(P)-dependent dehydrogenase (short-subunit alcohol dehydrogenase family)
VLFAREGAKVLAADLKLDAAVETKRIIESEGGICMAVAGDVCPADHVTAIVDTCLTAFGRIEVLHNNVGIVELGSPVETSEESWDRVSDVNLKSMFLTWKQVLPQTEQQGKGAIVKRLRFGRPLAGGFLHLLRSDQSRGHSVHSRHCAPIRPVGHPREHDPAGMMNTPMVHAAEVIAAYGGSAEEMVRRRDGQCPIGHMGDAWDVAYAALFLASDEAEYITGTELVVDGGLTVNCV